MFPLHSKEELIRRQKLPLEEKIRLARMFIQEWYRAWNGQVYVSFSGGKDSSVLLHLVRQLYPEVPALYIHTGLEYPEVVQFVRSTPNVEIIRPKITFKQLIEKYGYPVHSKMIAGYVYELRHGNVNDERRQRLTDGAYVGRDGKEKRSRFKIPPKLLDAPFEISNACCYPMKKAPSKEYEKRTGRHPYIGTTAEESHLRTQSWVKYSDNSYRTARPMSRPISVWTVQDVLEYVRRYDIPIPSIYGEIVEEERPDGRKYLRTTGEQRTGCMYCMYGAQHRDDRRFLIMKETHPKIYAWCMKPRDQGGLGLDGILTYLEIPH